MFRMIPRSIKFCVYLKLKKPAKDFSIWSHCFPAYISFYLLHVHVLIKVCIQYTFSHLNVEQIFTNVSQKIIWGHHFLQRNTKLRYSLSRSTRKYFSRPTLGRIVFTDVNEYMKDHIFELRRKIWICDWSSQLHTQLKQLWN